MPPRLYSAVLAAAALSAPASADTFVYVHDRGTVNQVYAYELAKTGELAPVADSPFVSTDPIADSGDLCGGLCQTLAADKKSARLFSSGDTGITVWNVGEDGSLSAVAGSPFGATSPLFGVAAVRVGKRLFVYAAESELGQLRGFEAQADGTLVELASSPVAADAAVLGVSSAKSLLFAASEQGRVSSFVVGADGALALGVGSPLAPDPTPVFVFNAVPDAKGKLLFVADDGFDDPANDANDLPPAVYVFAVDKRTAALSPAAGSPFETALPIGLGMTGASTAKKLVVAVGFEQVTADLQVFKIGKKGVLAPLGVPQDSGINAQSHAFDTKGKWFFVASAERVRVNRVDGKTGIIQSVDEEEFAADAETNAIVVLSR